MIEFLWLKIRLEIIMENNLLTQIKRESKDHRLPSSNPLTRLWKVESIITTNIDV